MPRTSMWIVCSFALLAWLAPAAAGTAGKQTVTLGETDLEVFTYRPSACAPAALLIVFTGLNRNAANYRDYARPLADRFCLVVATPLFDKTRFPSWRYQRGGLVEGGKLVDSERWTGWIVLQLVDWLRHQQGNATMPYLLLGHSAGAQFLSRFAAFIPKQAQRIVIANPSTWVMPALDVAPPYGFKDVPSGEALLRRYLAAPVTVLLGQEDTGSKNLAENDEAEAQGANRLARGEATFLQAQTVAQQHNWPFSWRLIRVPGVGHDARSMFASPMAGDALGLAAPR